MDMGKKYKFKIENDMYEWDSETITGLQIRSLGPGIPRNMDLFLKLPGNPGKLVKDTDNISLSENGVEKFYAQEASSTAG
jgi:hypothetical protein